MVRDRLGCVRPLGLSLGIWVQTAPGPLLLWIAAGAAWGTGLAALVYSITASRDADRTASVVLTEIRGYRMKFSCPISPRAFWARALARAGQEHEAHVGLTNEVGVSSAVELLAQARRSAQRPTRIVLRLVGFLVGFVFALVVAIILGQTTSAGVLAVFAVACSASVLAPIPFRSRFDAAIGTFRQVVKLAHDLSSALSR